MKRNSSHWGGRSNDATEGGRIESAQVLFFRTLAFRAYKIANFPG
jgi:hypothetical protein